MLKNIERAIRHRIRSTKPDSELYSPQFYVGQQDGSRASAKVVLPLVIDIVKPKRAVDVGCGVGTWVAELLEHSIDARGLDGAHVQLENLHIPADRFVQANLNDPPQASEIGQFDLAMCLEVAEHLEAANSQKLLTFLTGLAPVILFGAAIPGQGGRNHINEQWQSHWIGRFRELGFACHDVIRPKTWENKAVRPWYSQNTFLFARADAGLDLPPCSFPSDLVHPQTFERKRKK